MICCLCIINSLLFPPALLGKWNGSATMKSCKPAFAQSSLRVSTCGALAAYELETEVDNPLLRPLTRDRGQRHGNRLAADFVAMRADAGDRRERRLHHVEVVEADDADGLRHRDRGTVAFEQNAKHDIVSVAEDAVERRHLGQRIAEKLAAKRHTGQ